MFKFDNLWLNYPDKDALKKTCFNKQLKSSAPFSDYCAIMLSESLIKSGITLNSFKGSKCWSHPGLKHALLAEQLAHWLEGNIIQGLGKTEKINPAFFQKELDGKTGIIFFKDYWQRGKETFENRSGDHIDLWNRNKITSSGMFLRSILEFMGRVSDLNKSKEIWFWEVK